MLAACCQRAYHEDQRFAPPRQTDPTSHGTASHGWCKPSTSASRSEFAGALQWLLGMTWYCCWGCHWSFSPRTAHSSPVNSKSSPDYPQCTMLKRDLFCRRKEDQRKCNTDTSLSGTHPFTPIIFIVIYSCYCLSRFYLHMFLLFHVKVIFTINQAILSTWTITNS